MTQLEIMLHQPYASGSVDASALLSVRLLADPTGAVVKEWWRVEKPARVVGESGQLEDFTTFELPRGGYYSIDVTTPRGPRISKEFLVEEGTSLREVITFEASPHEYLGWQQYAGILRNRSGLRAQSGAVETGVVGNENVGWDKYEIPKVFRYIFASAEPQWFSVRDLPDPYYSTPTINPANMLNWQFNPDTDFVTWFPQMPTSEQGNFLVQALRMPEPNVADNQFPRWIGFETNRHIDLASVPWPWFGMDLDRQFGDEIRFLYDRIRPSAVDSSSPGYLNLSIQDHRWFGLLEFLASDRMSRAGEMLTNLLPADVAENALYGKVRGPLVAVAGGIYLVSQAKNAKAQFWDQWLENLMNWFPGIPDGAILLGSRKLQLARSITDFEEAFGYFLESVRRGIPFFSASVRMLSLGLAQISDGIPDAEELRRAIAFIATRVDPTQPFTVIRVRN
jgi:hypothetical protein